MRVYFADGVLPCRIPALISRPSLRGRVPSAPNYINIPQRYMYFREFGPYRRWVVGSVVLFHPGTLLRGPTPSC